MCCSIASATAGVTQRFFVRSAAVASIVGGQITVAAAHKDKGLGFRVYARCECAEQIKPRIVAVWHGHKIQVHW
jgi:hypothetical protein